MSKFEYLKQAIQHHDEKGALEIVAEIEKTLAEIVPALDNSLYVRSPEISKNDYANHYLDQLGGQITRSQVDQLKSFI